MDEKSGVDLIKEIREVNKTIRIIVISAFCDSDTVHSLINEHVYSFFMKPLNVKEFINKLREIEKKINDDKIRHSELYKNKNFNFLNKEEK
jgi:YesN/AraC family two-component response regulator